MPQRSCVGCGKVRPKRELVRLVRTAADTVEIDPIGRKAGRGAYLCPDPECWHLALKRNKLGHVLRTKLSVPDIKALEEAKLLLQAESHAVKGDGQ